MDKRNTAPSPLIPVQENTEPQPAWAQSLSQPELERLTSFFSLLIQIDQRLTAQKKGASHEMPRTYKK